MYTSFDMAPQLHLWGTGVPKLCSVRETPNQIFWTDMLIFKIMPVLSRRFFSCINLFRLAKPHVFSACFQNRFDTNPISEDQSSEWKQHFSHKYLERLEESTAIEKLICCYLIIWSWLLGWRNYIPACAKLWIKQYRQLPSYVHGKSTVLWFF